MGGEWGTYAEKKGTSGVLLGHLKERDHLKYLGVNGRIKLKWIYKR